MATTIPAWLREHCLRLCRKDDSLIHLNLNIRRVNERIMMRELAAAVCQSPHLLVLNLTSSLVSNNNNNNSGGTGDCNEALEELVQQVIPHQNSSLKVLHLSYNQLCNVTIIGQSLQMNQNLIELHLSYNRITPESAAYIAQGLQVNHTLKVLNLNCNEIGDEGTVKLAKVLKSNKSLSNLGLERNNIHQTGADALQDALLNFANFTLQEISIGKNEMSTVQEAVISTICRANKAGRGLLLTSQTTSTNRGRWNAPAILPLILGRAKNDPNVLFSLLLSCVDMLQTVVDNHSPLPQYHQHDGSSFNKRAKITK